MITHNQPRTRSIHSQDRELSKLDISHIGELLTVKLNPSTVRTHQSNKHNYDNKSDYRNEVQYFLARTGFGTPASQVYGTIIAVNSQSIELEAKNRSGGLNLHTIDLNAVSKYTRF